MRPLGEGMSAGAVQVDAEAVSHGPDECDQLGELCGSLTDRIADARCELDGVEEQFLVKPGLFAMALGGQIKELGGRIAEVAGHLVDEGKLPFNA